MWIDLAFLVVAIGLSLKFLCSTDPSSGDCQRAYL
jgi:hypothetical protein